MFVESSKCLRGDGWRGLVKEVLCFVDVDVCWVFVALSRQAVWKIEVENFPAFIVVDDKGNDFFSEWMG